MKRVRTGPQVTKHRRRHAGPLPQSGAITSVERLAVLGYLALHGAALLWIASIKPLWYDELFSWHVSRQEGPVEVMRALLAGADNGPPVDYWIRHFSLRWFGDSTLAFRLPSIVAYLLALQMLWLFARRRLSVVGAAVTILLPATSACLYYATEARAYAALLLLMALSLNLWQRCLEYPGTRRWPAALFAVLAISPLTHYYGVLNYLPVLVGEAWRLRRGGGWNPGLLAAMGASLLSLLLLPPFARNALEMREAFWASSFDLATPIHSYRFLLAEFWLPFLLLLVLGTACWLARDRRRASPSHRFRSHEIVALITLIALPLVVLLLAATVTNAMTHRYALASCLGLALLGGVSVDSVRMRFPRAALAMAVVLFVWPTAQLLRVDSRASREMPRDELAGLLQPLDGDIVADNSQMFLQSHHVFPSELRDRWLYLYSRENSRRHLGHDNDEIAMENLRAWAPVRTEAYDAFLAAQPEFYVVAEGSRGWLLSQLEDAGATIEPYFRAEAVEIYRVRAPGRGR